METVTVSISWV